MIKIQNDCCGCATPLYPCRGDDCELRHVEHYYCDECGTEDKLYKYNDLQLCEECLINKFEIVDGSDY